MVAERVITMPRFLFSFLCCRNFFLLYRCPTSTCNSNNNNKQQPWHKKWLGKMSDQKKIHVLLKWRMEKRELGEQKKEPFSIFSHTIECFAYPSVLSPGAANIFITRIYLLRCVRKQKRQRQVKEKFTQQSRDLILVVVCFRSFAV